MHGAAPALAGKNLLESKDPVTGKFFVKEQIEIAKTAGSGWASYNWTNPATKAMQMKKSWVQRVEGMDAYVVCGVFQYTTAGALLSKRDSFPQASLPGH